MPEFLELQQQSMLSTGKYPGMNLFVVGHILNLSAVAC